MAIYKLKFFPKHNAFVISPAPAHDTKDGAKKETFKWDFNDGDILEIDWDGEGITDAHLMFNSESSSKRTLPFKVPSPNMPDNWIEPPKEKSGEEGIYKLTKGCMIMITQAHAGARWGFDFCCKIGDEGYCVDPEMRIGRK